MPNIIGVDEVGMGCLAGPVVVCAVIAPSIYKIGDFGVRDSKQLTATKREEVIKKLKKLNINYKISLCYPKTIDKLNIYRASRLAMKKAVLGLAQNLEIFVDGPRKIPNLDLPQRAITKGDQKIFAIAAASILAKAYRDRMMTRYAKRFPQYGFERHKGYGTKFHVTMLTQHGPCILHRISFAPVGQMI